MRTTGPGQSALLLLDVVDFFSAGQVPYVVIGAMAASVHGVVRASLDADAALSLTPLELRDLERTCSAAGLQTDIRYGDEDDPISALLEVSDAFGNRVDLLTGIRGFSAEAFSRAIEVPFHGSKLRVAGFEDFIALKVFAGGPQHLEDARRVLEVAGDSLDVVLLERIVGRFGTSAIQSLAKVRGADS